jgi:hypothetical protein
LVKDKILEMVRSSAAREKPYGWLNYQPINLPGYEETIPLRGRDCFDRGAAIFAHLRRTFGEEKLGVADWGCNLGFFVFEAAKLGFAARGYDSDRRLVDACSFLARSTGLGTPPSFEVGTLSAESFAAAPPVDVVFCFSVLHHLQPEKDRFRAIEAIANRCRGAYVEMDGVDYGRKALELFFWRVEEVAQTDDRYGDGRRKRKTFFCTNRLGDRTYQNLKTRDFVFDRNVFLCTRDGGARTVVKRERAGARHSHTWLRTSLSHERDIYRRHASDFLPRLLDEGDGEFRWIEIEYLEPGGRVSAAEVDALVAWLEGEQLFMIDYREDSFIPSGGRLRMIDLESVFPVEGGVPATIERHSIDARRNPPHVPGHDSWEKQRKALRRAFAAP